MIVKKVECLILKVLSLLFLKLGNRTFPPGQLLSPKQKPPMKFSSGQITLRAFASEQLTLNNFPLDNCPPLKSSQENCPPDIYPWMVPPSTITPQTITPSHDPPSLEILPPPDIFPWIIPPHTPPYITTPRKTYAQEVPSGSSTHRLLFRKIIPE